VRKGVRKIVMGCSYRSVKAEEWWREEEEVGEKADGLSNIEIMPENVNINDKKKAWDKSNKSNKLSKVS
jgi:hypothetical protein